MIPYSADHLAPEEPVLGEAAWSVAIGCCEGCINYRMGTMKARGKTPTYRVFPAPNTDKVHILLLCKLQVRSRGSSFIMTEQRIKGICESQRQPTDNWHL